MKRIFILAVPCLIMTLVSCSKIEENTDPIIGIWANLTIDSISTSKVQNTRKEWIFNDAYMGRHHTIENGEITVLTDFQWERKGDVYVIHYPGMPDWEDAIVRMSSSEDHPVLVDGDGSEWAIRE